MNRRWSYSSLREFQQCPYRWKLRRLDKHPVPPAAPDSPLTRGTLYHQQIEEFIRGDSEELPKIKSSLAKETIHNCRTLYQEGRGRVEHPSYLTPEWTPTTKNAEDHWLTTITDFEYVNDEGMLVIIDWKTGKTSNKEVPHALQAQLYAVAALACNPSITLVETQFVYLDGRSITTKRVAKGASEPFRITWHNQAVQLTNATEFPAKPITLNCKYCDFGAQVGTGVCVYDHYGTTALLPSTGSCRVPVAERPTVFSLRPWNGQNPSSPALHYSSEELTAYFQELDNSAQKHPPTELDDGHNQVHESDVGDSGSRQT